MISPQECYLQISGLAYDSIPSLRTEPLKSYWIYPKNPMIIPGSTIHKQKRKFFAVVSVSLCLPLPTPTFHKTMPRFWKSSSKRCSRGMRRSSSEVMSG